VEAVIDSVDLDRTGYDLFCEHCPAWVDRVNWQHSNAVDWLRRPGAKFALLMDDLSVSHKGDVVKPAICWGVLPELIHRRLRPGGVAVFNLMLPPGGRWNPDLNRLAGGFKTARVVDFDEFENRILVGADDLPSARELGLRLCRALRQLRSRQSGRIHLRNSSPAAIARRLALR
jgi:hypothetical protein